jgi:hypothetical protein
VFEKVVEQKRFSLINVEEMFLFRMREMQPQQKTQLKQFLNLYNGIFFAEQISTHSHERKS